MDYMMPVMNGLDATRAIRAKGYTLPIIGLTANAFRRRPRSVPCGRDERFHGQARDPDQTAVDTRTFLQGGPRPGGFAPRRRDRGPRCGKGRCRAPAERASRAGRGRPEDPGRSPAQSCRSAPVAVARPERIPAEHARAVAIAEIDTRQFDALVADLGTDIVADLLFSFGSDSATLIAEIAAASHTADEAALDRALHSLKGVSQTVGLSWLADRAQSLRGGPFPDADMIAILRAAADRGLATLTAMLAAHDPDADAPPNRAMA